MAGMVTSTRITDANFYFTRRGASTGGLLKGDVFDVSKSYSSSWSPALQRTTSYRSGRAFMRALSDPQQTVAEEDLRDVPLPDNSDDLMFRTTNDLKRQSQYDHGHPFSTIKIERELTTVDFSSSNGMVSYHGPLAVFCGNDLNSPFDGNVLPSGAPSVFASSAWPVIDTSFYGPKAISKTIPTLPASGMAAFLGELHEGLPKLIGHSLLFKERAHAFQGIGSEYLNVQFGWKPFVSDLKKFLKAFTNAHAILDQYRKQSGKVQRRHYAFPVIRDSKVYAEQSIDPQGGANPPSARLRFPTNNTVYGALSSPEIDSMIRFGTSSSIHASYVRTQRYKFTGAFSYLLSEDDSFLGRMERYAQLSNKLLGIRITPDVLWELTPWSWLADWEANIGVNITNATALGQDNLVLRWGYLMRETTLRHYTSTSNVRSYSGFDGPLHSSYKVSCKERVRSTPYGFGLNPSGFTDHQWSILGALGLTKAPKTLF